MKLSLPSALRRHAPWMGLLLAATSLSFAHSEPLDASFGVGADDFVTGGGWIDGTPDSARANFGFKAGVNRDGGPVSGHLNYIDHGSGLHLRSSSITAYAALDEITREFSGTALAGGQSVTFVATVSDAGEPGTSDTFSLTLSDGYSASGTLRGGNVQIHQ